MDHLIDNEGKPIPSADTSTGREVVNVDEDEDDEDLRAALNLSKGQPDANKGEGSTGEEAKVTTA